jgi:hypothetical protein
MDTHSYDGPMSFILYTRHLLFSPFLYFDSVGLLSSSNLTSTLPLLDLYACTGFPLAAMQLAEPQPGSGISVVSRDTSSVETTN